MAKRSIDNTMANQKKHRQYNGQKKKDKKDKQRSTKHYKVK